MGLDKLRNLCILFSKMIVVSLLLSCDERWQNTFHTKLANSNSLCITTARDAKNLRSVGSSTTRGRTVKKSLGSGTQLPYLVQRG